MGWGIKGGCCVAKRAVRLDRGCAITGAGRRKRLRSEAPSGVAVLGGRVCRGFIWRLVLMLCGRVALSTGLAICQADSAETRKLATLVSAAASVKAQAKHFIAMSREEVGMRLRRRRRACLVRLKNSLRGLAGIAFAAALIGALACRRGGERPRLQKGVHVCSYACELVQSLIQSPPLRHELGYLVPQGAICLQKFLSVCGAQAGGGGHGLRAKVQDLFVKSLKHREVRAIAESNGIAKHCLLACEPGRVEAHVLHREFRRLIKEGRANELRLCAERARRAGLNDVLVLLAGEPHLPGDPFYGAPWLEPHVHARCSPE